MTSEPTANPQGGSAEGSLVPAAMYVRMSTEHQQYSTENQGDTIRQWAQRNGYEIIEVFADEGKSGLDIAGRAELQRLLQTVTSGKAQFKAILAYDVSRWGRFQDADESAHYEYLCKRAGIDIHYCAEQFKNDGSIGSSIIKTVKRTMAAEYSRELSVKVFAGQCRLIGLGFRQGGHAGFGLRRMLLDHQGKEKGTLEHGEQKSIQTDRIVLTPGPDEEVETVRWMYRAFVDEGKMEGEIAAALTARGIRTDLGRLWSVGTVRQVLSNEKYIGNNIFNRTSGKLKHKRTDNPPDLWIRSDGAFDGIVDTGIFYKAQGILLERSRRYTNEEMLERLRTLYKKHGRVSGILIDEEDAMPSAAAYQGRFGGLLRAYQLIGYSPDVDYSFIEVNRRLRERHPELVAEVVSQLEEQGSTVEQDPDTGLLLVNREVLVSLVLSRCTETAGGRRRWKIRIEHGRKPDLTIAVRMSERALVMSSVVGDAGTIGSVNPGSWWYQRAAPGWKPGVATRIPPGTKTGEVVRDSSAGRSGLVIATRSRATVGGGAASWSPSSERLTQSAWRSRSPYMTVSSTNSSCGLSPTVTTRAGRPERRKSEGVPALAASRTCHESHTMSRSWRLLTTMTGKPPRVFGGSGRCGGGEASGRGTPESSATLRSASLKSEATPRRTMKSKTDMLSSVSHEWNVPRGASPPPVATLPDRLFSPDDDSGLRH